VPATWLTILSWLSIGSALVSAAWIAFDVLGRGYRQRMRVMEIVWPVTALYFGPLAVVGYRRYGRASSPRWLHDQGLDEAPAQPHWAGIAKGVSHCGAGCTLGDLIAEWSVFAFGATVAGLALVPEYIGDYLAALFLGIVFQYFAIAPMRGLGVRAGLVQAAKADVLSLSAFEVGLFGWMALVQLVFFTDPHLEADHAAYWFLMQLGMILGFFTAWPVNVWLVRRGIKEAM
jgi:hypothetical protein